MFWKREIRYGTTWLVILILAVSLLAGCSGAKAPTQPPVSAPPAVTVSEFSQIAAAADKYLAAGRPPTISVQDVYDRIVVGGAPGYFILSIRSPEHYVRGHIKGAVNIPYKEIWEKENLAKLPKDKKIVVVCYTGHTASQVTMLLNLLGYEAYAMKYGMAGWTSNQEVLGMKPPDCKAPNYPVDTTPVEAKATNEPPRVETGQKDLTDIILARAQAYLTSGRSPTIDARDVYDKVVVGGDTNYVILSIRSPEHYAKGHVKSAINIPYAGIAREENLKKLSKDKKIIVICYTGHTASQATMLLNLLGYEAYAMKFGMSGWTDKPEVLNQKVFDCKPPNYPVISGPNP